MPKTVILSAARTPIGKLGGGLSTLDATELGATAIKAALERAEVEPEQVQHVVMGQVIQAGQGQIPSRQAQIKAGIPKEVSSETINKVCASGIRAAGHARHGDPRRRPRGRRRRRDGVDVARAVPAQAGSFRLPDGRRQGDRRDDQRRAHQPVLRQAHGAGGQRGRGGARADARRHGSRGRCARMCARSRRPTRAGCPRRSSPVTIKGRKGDTVVEVDEAPRRDASIEALAKLPPIFMKDGSHTAGNSPGVNDGGGALVLASDEWAKRNGKTRARDDRRAGGGRRRLRLSRPHAREGRPEGAREGRTEGRGHRSVGDQRGVRVGHAQLDADARNRRGQGQRQRRRGRARPSDRRLRRRILGSLVLRAAPPRRRPRCAAICSGGGQGDAVIVEVNGG